MTTNFYQRYLKEMADKIQNADVTLLQQVSDLIRHTRDHKGKVIVVGNGGSAAMASHVSGDLTKAIGIRAINFNEADLITCLANDFGYEHWVARALEYYADSHDLVILISSSGRSLNMVNGAQKARAMGLKLVTLSGFAQDNPLRQLGSVNLWLDSKDYNVVEMTHHVWLLAIIDALVK